MTLTELQKLILGEPNQMLVSTTIDDCQVTLHQDVVGPLTELLTALRQAGLATTIVSHWRSFEHQAKIWNSKWHGSRTLLNRQQETIDVSKLTDQEKLTAICWWSAIPGTSRHHWGTDFDIFLSSPIEQGYRPQLTPKEFYDNGPCFKLEQWIELNLTKFGFFRPYDIYRGGVMIEPWHISYKPIADKLISQIDKQKINQRLALHKVAGHEMIAEQIDSYLETYVFNV
ncbi:MAG: M15 family metallopeptidase [Kangiellaceae bacterium]|jgi:LAS superfamily LD-carboxypeptidase LdcB|nr:M15 family metallopeptidase [Kangiellaceae bacterium]